MAFGEPTAELVDAGGVTLDGVNSAQTEHSGRANVWVVRADGGKYTAHFVAHGYAGTGGVDVSSAKDPDEIRRLCERAYPTRSARSIGQEVSQLCAFLFDVREGDYVITPERDTERLRYGRVIGPCVSAAGDNGCPYRNRRGVDWDATTLERTRFSESFQNTIGSLRAIFRVSWREEFLARIGRPASGLEGRVEPTAGPDGQVQDNGATKPRRRPPDGEEDAGHGDRRSVTSDSGVEEERDDPQAAIEHPFDPSKIKVRTEPAVVGLLLTRIEHDEIDLAPDFQRLSGIWNAEKKSRLIESLLLRIPIPVFYVAADEEERWAVVDGVQRLSTIRDYVAGRFPLSRLEYRSEFEGRRFADLPRAMQRRIGETQFVVNVIEPGTPPEVTFNIFRRINTGGMTLNGQEIRHALNPGPVRAFLKELAESEEFAKATDGSIRKIRMDDRACVLRFLAFHVTPWEEYSGSSLDGHLDAAMKALNRMGRDRRSVLAADFRKAMRAAADVFGDDAFRKRYSPGDFRRPISMALFEAWSVQLARCSQERIDRLVERRDDARERFMDLLNRDQEFDKAISVSTGSPRRIRKRFAAVRDLVQEVV